MESQISNEGIVHYMVQLSRGFVVSEDSVLTKMHHKDPSGYTQLL